MKRLFALLFVMTLATAAIPDLAELNRMIARYAPAELRADTSTLAPGDRQALAKLLEAAHVIDTLFITQLWSGNAALHARLEDLIGCQPVSSTCDIAYAIVSKAGMPQGCRCRCGRWALRAQKPAPWTSCPGVSTISPR